MALAGSTQLTERLPSLATPPAAPTRPPVLKRSSATPPAAATQLMVIMHLKTTPPAAAISPWALEPAVVSLLPIMLFVSAPLVITWTTAAISATYSARHLPMELPSSLIQTAGSEQ